MHGAGSPPPARLAAPSPAPPPPELRAELEAAARDPRRRFGRYLMLRELGVGGFGAVWRAWDAQRGRLVALKLLLRFGARAEVRFQQEARATARLQHPNIVPLLDHGVHEGRPYLATGFVSGATLGASRLEPLEAAAVLRDVARAIQYAHERGVLHRDIKPDNVLVDGAGKPWVVDFGMAALEGSGEGLTRTGDMIGTPAYMPPEQVALRRRDVVDERSDVYSLGATLYHALTGEPPFRASSIHVLIVAVASEPPTPPSRKRPQIPPALDAVVLKALAKDPAARYASARELAEDLERVLRHEPTRARRERPLFAATRLRGLVAAAGVVALVIGVWAVASSLAEPTPRAADAGDGRAPDPAQELSVDGPRAPPASASPPPAAPPARDPPAAASDPAAPARQPPAASEPPVRPRSDARSLPAGGEQRAADPPATASPDEQAAAARGLLLARARELATSRPREAVAALDELLAAAPGDPVALRLRAELREGAGALDAAWGDLEALLAAEPAPAPAAEATLRRWRARVAQARGQEEVALAELDRALELDPDDPDALLARARLSLARIEPDPEALPRALHDASRAVRLRPHDAAPLVTLAAARERSGQRRQAEDELRRAAALDPEAVDPWRELAALRLRAGEPRGALDAVEQALAIAPRDASLWHLRGRATEALGERDAALDDLGRALELDPSLAAARADRARLREAVGDLAGAREDRARLASGAPPGPGTPAPAPSRPPPWLAFVRVPAPALADVLDEHVRVLWAGAEALAQVEARLERRPDDAAAWLNLGQARRARGQYQQAVAAFSRAIELAPRRADPWLGRAACHLAEGRADRAAADYGAAAEAEPHRVEAWRGRGLARLQARRAADALPELTRALELRADDVPAALARAQALAALGRAEEAVTALRALARGPGRASAPAHVELGRLELAHAAYAAARSAFTTAGELDPREPRAHAGLAVAALALGDRARAGQAAERAVELDPARGEWRLVQGAALALAGDEQAALAAYDAALRLDRDLAEGYALRGLARAALGHAGARRDLERCLRLAPAHAGAEVVEQALAALER